MCDDEISWVFRFNLLKPTFIVSGLFTFFALCRYCNTLEVLCQNAVVAKESTVAQVLTHCKCMHPSFVQLYKWKSGQFWYRTQCSRRTFNRSLFNNVSLEMHKHKCVRLTNKQTCTICTQLNVVKTWIKNVIAIKFDCVNILINFMRSASVHEGNLFEEYSIVMQSHLAFTIWKIKQTVAKWWTSELICLNQTSQCLKKKFEYLVNKIRILS